MSKTYLTVACKDGEHQWCPGWFRENIGKPWSNKMCGCECHAEKGEQ